MMSETINVIKKEEVPSYYINNIEASGGIFDITLKCLYRQDDKAIHQCSLVMSPQHAKSLLGMLNQLVSTYETEVMELSIKDGNNE